MSKSKKKDLFAALVFFLLGSYVIYLTLTTFVTDQAAGGGVFANSAFYPQLLAGLIVFLSLILGLSSLIKTDNKKHRAGENFFLEEDIKSAYVPPASELTSTMIIIIALVQILYTILLGIIGYLLTTPLYLAFMFRVLKMKNWVLIGFLSLVSTAVVYVFFSTILNVILPEMMLFGSG